jgi:hypothetical protein
MAKPYSNDLRTHVIMSVEEGATLEEAAERHHVSLSSVTEQPDITLAEIAAKLAKQKVAVGPILDLPISAAFEADLLKIRL